MKTKLAVVGLGRIGQLHAKNIHFNIDQVELVALCDPIPEFAQKVLNEIGHQSIPIYQDINQMFQKAKIDGVLITSPTNTHLEFIQIACQYNVPVFCEKPIDLDYKKINHLIKNTEAESNFIQVGFNRRYDPHFSQLKALLNQGQIGKIHQLKITSRDPEPAPLEYLKTSGGIFHDMTIHDFDMLNFLYPKEVDTIFATGSCMISKEIQSFNDFDTTMVTIKYIDGTMAMIDNSRKAVYGYDQRIEAFGEKGTIKVENPKQNTIEVWNEDYFKKHPLPYFFLERYNQSYIDEIASFAQKIQKNELPDVDLKAAHKACLMAEAATLSANKNTPIKMSELWAL